MQQRALITTFKKGALLFLCGIGAIYMAAIAMLVFILAIIFFPLWVFTQHVPMRSNGWKH